MFSCICFGGVWRHMDLGARRRTAGLAYGEVRGAPSASARELGEDKPGLGSRPGGEAQHSPHRLQKRHTCAAQVRGLAPRTTPPPNALPNRPAAAAGCPPRGLATSQRRATPWAGGPRARSRGSNAAHAPTCPRAPPTTAPSKACPFLPPTQRPDGPPNFPISQLFHCFLFLAHPTVPQLSNYRD